MSETVQPSTSPRWSGTTKLVVALTVVAIVAGLLIRFRQIVGLLLVSFILAYLLYPVTSFMHRRLRVPWRLATVIILVFVLAILLSLLTVSGLALFEQIQNLVGFLDTRIRDLPNIIAELTAHPIQIGIFQIDLSQYDLPSLASQLLGMIQPLLSNLTSIIGKVAAGAASTVGWFFFSVLIAYFILNESGGAPERLINLQIPGYSEDIARFGQELNRIWNAFLRGQIIIFVITVLVYIPVLGALGVSFYVGLALLAGLARFVPYIGPWVTWITYGLVSYLQGSTIFGLEPWIYVVLVLGTAIIIDFVLDNFLVPRLMGSALNIHPAAIMVAALISASLFGLIGVLLAAPVTASIKLIGNYIFRKMFDLDPWEGMAKIADREPSRMAKWISKRFRNLVNRINQRFRKQYPNGLPLLNWVEEFRNWFGRAIQKNVPPKKRKKSVKQSLNNPEPNPKGEMK